MVTIKMERRHVNVEKYQILGVERNSSVVSLYFLLSKKFRLPNFQCPIKFRLNLVYPTDCQLATLYYRNSSQTIFLFTSYDFKQLISHYFKKILNRMISFHESLHFLFMNLINELHC